MDGEKKNYYDTALSNENINNDNHSNEYDDNNYFSLIDFSNLGELHPLKFHVKIIFELLISSLQSINVITARENIIARQKASKIIYPDAVSLDRTQNILS